MRAAASPPPAPDCSGPRNPGRVTLRRLNRTEYNNTIRDLIGVDFKPAGDFPADDVGYGFDNIGDVLSLSPLLLERYLAAADTILEQAIVVAEDVRVQVDEAGDDIQSGGVYQPARLGGGYIGADGGYAAGGDRHIADGVDSVRGIDNVATLEHDVVRLREHHGGGE